MENKSKYKIRQIVMQLLVLFQKLKNSLYQCC